MKIVWVSHSQKLGGAERSLVEAVQGLVAQGHKIVVVIPSDGELTSVLKKAGAKVIFISSGWWVHDGSTSLSLFDQLHKILSLLRSTIKIWACLLRIRPNLVVTNTLTVPTGAFATKLLGLPHIWYIHEFGQKDHGLVFDWGQRISMMLINRLSTKVIVNSQAMLKHFARTIPINKLRLVHYALDMPAYIPKNPIQSMREGVNPCLQLLLMGQLAPGKRQEDAVRALYILKKNNVDVRLTIVGSEHNPDYSAMIRRIVADLGMEQYVTFFPFSADPLHHMMSSDIVLMCSQHEAFGRVTVEAMKMGKPVVGANSAGTTELIQDGVNGFFYVPGDAKDMASKIGLLYSDRALCEEMGQNAKQWSHQTFSSKNYTKALTDVFEEVTR